MGRGSAARDVVFGCLVGTIAVLSMLVGLSIADNFLPSYRMPATTPAMEQQIAVESLRAAQATANWTFWMLMLGIASFVVTAIGAYFVWRTLRETSAATTAAIESLDHTRKSTHAELRAYLIVDSMTLMDFGPGLEPRVICKLVNAGQTPARRTSSIGQLRLLDKVDACFLFENFHKEAPTREIGPGRQALYEATTGEVLTQQDIDSIAMRNKIYVFGFRCSYYDVFGKRHRTIARAFLANVSAPAGSAIRLNLVRKNNRAN